MQLLMKSGLMDLFLNFSRQMYLVVWCTSHINQNKFVCSWSPTFWIKEILTNKNISIIFIRKYHQNKLKTPFSLECVFKEAAVIMTPIFPCNIFFSHFLRFKHVKIFGSPEDNRKLQEKQINDDKNAINRWILITEMLKTLMGAVDGTWVHMGCCL